MNPSQIDEAILSAVAGRWTKVAMVIARVTKAMANDLPSGGEGCQVVASHIEGLVSNGILVAQVNIKNWRFSEVRLAGENLEESSN
jgi:hypothetical protein